MPANISREFGVAAPVVDGYYVPASVFEECFPGVSAAPQHCNTDIGAEAGMYIKLNLVSPLYTILIKSQFHFTNFSLSLNSHAWYNDTTCTNSIINQARNTRNLDSGYPKFRPCISTGEG